MTKVIKAGMYVTEDDNMSTSVPTIDKKYYSISLDNGQSVKVINPSYVEHLERQILELNRKVDIQESKISKHDSEIRTLRHALRTLEKRIS